MKIILIHGFFDTGNIFKTLQKELESQGYACYSPSLKPKDARLGLTDLSAKLKSVIDENTKTNEPIVIIAYSMGTLVARYYLQELGGYTRTKAFFSISGPHQGTLTAYGYPWQGAKDMRPNSQFLAKLKSSEQRLHDLAIYTYRTPFDLMILPSSSSDLPMAINKKVPALGHRPMLTNKAVINDIVSHLKLLKT
jgi:triacylglycerol lipase